MFGYFNEILSNNEKLGGVGKLWIKYMVLWMLFLNVSFLRLELLFSGSLYTCSCGSGSSLILKRLDRCLATSTWISMYSHALKHLSLRPLSSFVKVCGS